LFYTEVDADGHIVRSCYTEDPAASPAAEGNRALPDSAPSYDPHYQTIVRVEPVPADATEVVYEVTSLPIAQARGVAMRRIEKWRTEAIQSAIVTFNGKRFNADRDAGLNISSTVTTILAGIPLPTGFGVISADDEDVPLTGEEIIDLAEQIFLSTAGLFGKSSQLKAQAKAATTIAELQAIVW